MIIPSPRLFRYLARIYLTNFLALMGLLLLVVYTFDIVELMRRAAKVGDVDFTSLLGLAVFKLPDVGQLMMPFAVMFAAIFTCWRLTKTQEIVVMRAAGMSAWQFLAPMAVSALMLGVLATTVINPVSALLLDRYTQKEARVLSINADQMTIARTGIWLRQGTPKDAPPALAGYALIHAETFDAARLRLSNVTVFDFDSVGQFRSRIESPVAVLHDGYWAFQDAREYRRDGDSQFKVKHLATTLTAQDIEDTLASPDIISFWKIIDYIGIMRDAGFPTTRMEIYLQSLLAKPLLFVAMILLAATFSLRLQRFGGAGALIGLGVFAGFSIFFAESMLQAFGLSQKIPVFLAAWTSPVLALLVGVAGLLHTEDG